MDLAEIAVSRRTVHNYKTSKVADALVEKALALSLWAPNHKLTFPWAYYWLGENVRQQLADLSVELKMAKKPLSETERKAARDNVTNPSHLIALGHRRDANPQRMHENFATLACSVQIAALYLWENGVGSKWSTGEWCTNARTYEILGVSPQEIQLEGALMVGVPLMVPASPPRPALDKFLRHID
jgi:nitroreductase